MKLSSLCQCAGLARAGGGRKSSVLAVYNGDEFLSRLKTPTETKRNTFCPGWKFSPDWRHQPGLNVLSRLVPPTGINFQPRQKVFPFVSVGVFNRDKNSSPTISRDRDFLLPPARAVQHIDRELSFTYSPVVPKQGRCCPKFFPSFSWEFDSANKCCEGLLLHPRVML